MRLVDWTVHPLQPPDVELVITVVAINVDRSALLLLSVNQVPYSDLGEPLMLSE